MDNNLYINGKLEVEDLVALHKEKGGDSTLWNFLLSTLWSLGVYPGDTSVNFSFQGKTYAILSEDYDYVVKTWS